MYKTTRAEHKKETLENIRAAVDALVAQKGFKNVTMREICLQSGIGLSTFYNYFSSKDDLLFDRYQRLNTTVQNFYETELVHLGPSDALKRLMQFMMAHIRTRVFEMLLNYHQVELRDVQKWYEAQPYSLFPIMEAIIDKGVETGEFQVNIDKQWVRDYLWFCINGAATMQCMTKGGFLKDDKALHEFEKWIDGLCI